jgi:hypothetical protein
MQRCLSSVFRLLSFSSFLLFVLFSFCLLLPLLVASPALAQYHHDSIPTGTMVSVQDAAPTRPLTLQKDGSWGHAGLLIDLSANTIGDVFAVPLGFGFGLLPELEVGISTTWQFWRFYGGNFLSSTRVYGRYHFMPGMLAFEGAIYPRGGPFGGTTFEFLTPARYEMGPLTIYGQGRLVYGLGTLGIDTTHSFIVGFAGSGLYEIMYGFFASLDLGLTIQSNDSVTSRSLAAVVPVGVGGGYRLDDNTALKLVFMFTNIAATSIMGYAGLDGRAVEIAVVRIL